MIIYSEIQVKKTDKRISTAHFSGLENILLVIYPLKHPNPVLDKTVGIDWDRKTRTKNIFRIVGSGHKGWSRNVDRELGNYDYLMGADVRSMLFIHHCVFSTASSKSSDRLITGTLLSNKIYLNGVLGLHK